MSEWSPKISIIIPVYNTAPYLKQCLDSLINQTLKDIEIICVNDGSWDDSLIILTNYVQQDSRVKLINQKNTGQSGARNNGLKIAAGEYIMFVDSDDWVELNICQELYNAAHSENADCAMCSYVKEFEKKSVITHVFDDEYVLLDKNQTKYRFHRRLFGLVGAELSRPEDGDLIVSPCMQIFKNKIAKGTEFVDLKLIGTAEDALYQIAVYHRCEKFIYIDKPLYHYRKTNTCSLTSIYKPDLFEKWQKLFDIMAEFIKKNCNEPIYHEALNNRIVLSIIGLGLNEISAKGKSDREKAARLREVLMTPSYEAAIADFSCRNMPCHWRVFFLLCKWKKPWILLGMLYCAEYLRKQKSWGRTE